MRVDGLVMEQRYKQANEELNKKVRLNILGNFLGFYQ